MIFLLFVCLLVPAAFGADVQIEAIRAKLLAMRGQEEKASGPRGATPQLTVVKHLLRDWIDVRLKAVAQTADVGAFERSLNGQIRDAELTCGWNDSDPQKCPERFLLGYLNELKVRRGGVFLVVQTGVGIECGFDESAYIYSWSDEGWRRIWENEQNDYVEKVYKPQALKDVLISPYNRGNSYLVLTLGTESWCASNWHDVYYRVFRLGPDPSVPPLVDGSEWAFVGPESLHGSVTEDEALVEFAGRSIDGGVHNREFVLHYKIEGDRATRIDPLALSPRDFVDEWITHDWMQAAIWSESAHRLLLRDRHKGGQVFGSFVGATAHCQSTPDLWQVGLSVSDPPELQRNSKETYFLVRWRPPYRFSMVNASDRPFPGCTQNDDAADERRTLFPSR